MSPHERHPTLGAESMVAALLQAKNEDIVGLRECIRRRYRFPRLLVSISVCSPSVELLSRRDA